MSLVIKFFDIFVILISLPAVAIYGPYLKIVISGRFGKMGCEKEHAKRVQDIQRQVKAWWKTDRKKKMRTGRPGWMSISPSKSDKSNYHKIQIGLSKVVKIDEKKMEVTVEPELMIGQLTRILTRRGYTIPVVPELDTVTIGGLIAGIGVETSSHKYGSLASTALSYEIVLADGSVEVRSKEHNPDLFYSVHGSLGTLGFITAVKFPLMKATPYAKITYHHCKGVDKTKELILANLPNHEFIEGLAFNEDDILIMLADFAQNVPASKPFNPINRWYKPLFHNHAKSIMKKVARTGIAYKEYVPLLDYYHRHTRGSFWCLEHIYPILKSKLMLSAVGWALPINPHLQRFAPVMNTVVRSRLIIQDYIVPMEHFQEFFTKSCRDIEIFPVWICPVRMPEECGMLPKGKTNLSIDVAYFGLPPANKDKVKVLKEFEKYCITLKGFQLFYADMHMSESQFKTMYDLTLYNKVRKEVGAENAFPTAFEKVASKIKG